MLAQSAGSEIDPFVLGSKNENDVQGYAGLPVNVNGLMYDYRADIEAAGAAFPLAKRYYVAVDSGSDVFTGKSLPGRYVLRAWIDDLRPPAVKLITTRLAAGRPTIVAVVTDSQSGVDPLSLVFNYNNNVLLGASAYDPGDRPRPLLDPVERPEDEGGEEEEERNPGRLRQPGDEEREHDRGQRAAEHELQARKALGRDQAHARLAPAESERMPARDDAPRSSSPARRRS